MMRLPSSTKNRIFIFTIGLVIFILIFQSLLQNVIFKSFFLESQKSIIEQGLMDIQSRFSSSSMGFKDLNTIMRNLDIQNDSIFYFEEIDSLKKDIENKKSEYYVMIEDQDGQTIKVIMDKFSFAEIYESDSLSIDALPPDANSNYYVAQSLLINESLYFQSPTYDDSSKYVKLDGSVTEVSPVLMEGFSFDEDRILEYELSYLLNSKDLLDELFEIGKIQTLDDVDTYTDLDYTLFFLPLVDASGKRILVASIMMYQSFDSTLLIINDFALINFGVALFICLLFSYLFSLTITKPLVDMESKAKKMADLDFSQKVEVHGTSEMKSLALSLNLLSEKLYTSIEDLKDANTRLEEDIRLISNQEKIRKQFISNASHELKTPITIISGLCEGIRDGVYGNEKIDSIHNESIHMKELVSSLLELTRAESRIKTEEKEVFNISDTFYKLLHRFKTMADSKGCQIDFECDDVFIEANPKDIEMIMSNLISNAIKYSRVDSSIDVVISEKGGNMIFDISNESDFISKDELERIWNPFYKLDSSGNKSEGGHGLGLSIVSKLLQGYKSSCHAKYQNGRVHFSFCLPSLQED